MVVTFEYIKFKKKFYICCQQYLAKLSHIAYIHVHRAVPDATQARGRLTSNPRGRMATSRVMNMGTQFAERTRPRTIIGQCNPLTLTINGTVTHLYPSGKIVLEYRTDAPNVRWVPVRLRIPGEYPEPADLPLM